MDNVHVKCSGNELTLQLKDTEDANISPRNLMLALMVCHIFSVAHVRLSVSGAS